VNQSKIKALHECLPEVRPFEKTGHIRRAASLTPAQLDAKIVQPSNFVPPSAVRSLPGLRIT
jgi:hypothetical protein